MHFVVHREREQGRAMKNMQSYYAWQTSHDLRKLYSKKSVRLQKLRGDAQGWFHKREIEALQQQMRWIEIELEARDSQLALF